MDKVKALRVMGCLNPCPENVTSELFTAGGNFFDPSDKLQVKYEMLRAVQIEGLSVTEASRKFGYSRETYYNVAHNYEMEGCIGLLDQAQGRRQPEKLSAEIVDFISTERQNEPKKNTGSCLAEKVLKRFHVQINSRTVYKVLKKMASQKPSRKTARRERLS